VHGFSLNEGWIMNRSRTFWRGVVAVVVVAAGLGTGQALPVAAENTVIVPRDSSLYGNTYGEWGARWMQWAFSIPVDRSPIADTTGGHCGELQSGPVWFLAGTFGTGPVTRSCMVPAGKALFFPLVATTFGAGVFDCEPTVPGTLCNLAALRVSAGAPLDGATLSATLDGNTIRHLRDQRVQLPAMTLTYPPDGVFGAAAGTYSPNVGDGYWLMVAPLSRGAHTLHFRAEVPGFVADVTYHLTVAP
jgi:hypothetical protein